MRWSKRCLSPALKSHFSIYVEVAAGQSLRCSCSRAEGLVVSRVGVGDQFSPPTSVHATQMTSVVSKRFKVVIISKGTVYRNQSTP
jgi:hypothetical protein